MRQIYAIAKAELRVLFYSPIAWLIMIIFSFQAYSSFAGLVDALTSRQEVSGFIFDATKRLFTDRAAIYLVIQKNLFLYIPLLTMGLMSREYSSGSIKLLYSSPLAGAKIIFGKYLSIIVFALIMMGTIVPTLFFTMVKVEAADITFMLSGFLGLTLLFFAYAAIGLYMSTLSSYQVVVAMLTLGVLALFNNIGSIGQNYDTIRDITHWLSLEGRADKFLEGLITSADIIYFLVFIGVFISLSIIKLYSDKTSANRERIIARYASVLIVASLVAYVSSIPKLTLYYDASQVKANTLTDNTRNILEKVEGKVKMTTYVNMADYNFFMGIPSTMNRDKDKFYDLKRFLPKLKMNYVYYYDEPLNNFDYVAGVTAPEDMARQICNSVEINFDKIYTPKEIKDIIDLWPENNTFVREIELKNGKKTFMRAFDDLDRYPTEAEIAAVFFKLTNKVPKVTFTTGYGEPSIEKAGESDYAIFAAEKPSRMALINQGFDVYTANLDETDNYSLIDSTDILVLADPKRELSSLAEERILKYLNNGGNMLLTIEPGREHYLKNVLELMGVETLEGVLVHPDQDFSPTLILSNVTPQANAFSHHFRFLFNRVVTMPSAVGLDYKLDGKFVITPLTITSSRGTWNEVETKNFETDTIKYNRAAGEQQRLIPTSFALSREIDGREQRIIIIGDAHTISNAEFTTSRKGVRSGNRHFTAGAIHWLSNGELPINVTREFPIDNKIFLTIDKLPKWNLILTWLIPALLTLIGSIILLRRRLN